jgi:hypothetical protein
VAAAGAVAANRLRRRAPQAVTAAAPVEPVDELRRKLDESRALAAEREEFESGETTVDRAEPVPGTLEERRRRVHEQAQAAVDEMRGQLDEPG